MKANINTVQRDESDQFSSIEFNAHFFRSQAEILRQVLFCCSKIVRHDTKFSGASDLAERRIFQGENLHMNDAFTSRNRQFDLTNSQRMSLTQKTIDFYH